MKKLPLLLSFIVCAVTVAACVEHSNFDDKIVSSAFVDTPKATLISCLGTPTDEKEVHTKSYLTYIGENNCYTIFVMKNNRVTDVIYTAANGKRIDAEQCQLSYAQCQHAN